MTEHRILGNRRAPLPNVAALATLVDRCLNRGPRMPGMGTFYGPSGFGKTEAAIYSANRYQAVYVQMGASWTKKKLCTAILDEIGRTPAKTIADMIEQIGEYLAINQVPLLIDEADFLLKRGMIEDAREIYEISKSPVILIGEEEMPAKLEMIERVHGRMLDWVGAVPGTIEDVAMLAEIYAEGVIIASDLQEKLLDQSHGSIRRICINLTRFHEHAMVHGLAEVDVQAWGQKEFYTGIAPKTRRNMR